MSDHAQASVVDRERVAVLVAVSDQAKASVVVREMLDWSVRVTESDHAHVSVAGRSYTAVPSVPENCRQNTDALSCDPAGVEFVSFSDPNRNPMFCDAPDPDKAVAMLHNG